MAAEPGTPPAAHQNSMDQQAGRVDVIAALLVALVVAGGTINAGPLILGDPDTLWQLRVGGDIWKTFSLPVQDTYSFTFAGQKWIAEQWLAQLILSAFYAMGGWRGVVALVGLSVGLAAFLFCREVGRATNPRIAAIITLIAFFLTSSVFNARPHILVLPIAVAWTAALFRAAERRQSPSFLLLALLVAWINLHGSFTIAILVAGFAFCHAVETHGLGDRSLLTRWAGFLACCLVAMVVHPYGVEPLLFAVKLARGNDWIPMIVEWLPLNAREAPLHEAALLAFFAILLWLRPKLSLSKIAFVIFALHMFLLHKRFVFAFTLLVPMVIIRDVVTQDLRLSRTAWVDRPRDFLERLIAERFGVTLAGLVAAAIIVPMLLLRNAIEPPSEVFAGKAIRFAQENLLPARVLNDYDFGGTLIFHGIPTFVDGRSGMLFLGKFAADVEESVRPDGASTFVRQLEEYKIGWTLLRNIDPRNLVLATLPQWQRVYSDDDVKIYRRVAGAASNTQSTDCLPRNQVSEGDGKNSECLR